jgi:hypothetical protein
MFFLVLFFYVETLIKIQLTTLELLLVQSHTEKLVRQRSL